MAASLLSSWTLIGRFVTQRWLLGNDTGEIASSKLPSPLAQQYQLANSSTVRDYNFGEL